MTDNIGMPLTERTVQLMQELLRRPLDMRPVQDIADHAGMPFTTAAALLTRMYDYSWVVATWIYDEGSGRRTRVYKIDAERAEEARRLVGAVRRETRQPSYSGALPPARTLAQIVATEPPQVVRQVCRQLGWPIPAEVLDELREEHPAP